MARILKAGRDDDSFLEFAASATSAQRWLPAVCSDGTLVREHDLASPVCGLILLDV